jgi:hypothetical protein
MLFLGMRRHTLDITLYCLENCDILRSPLVAKVFHIATSTVIS